MLLNPTRADFSHLDEASRKIMRQTIAFFEAKGKVKLKRDYFDRTWYADFLDFVGRNQIFATLLTPPNHAAGLPDARWDTHRNCDFNEILGFYGLAYWYTWQVTILGLGPIWMSANETVRAYAAEKLGRGGIFAFGLSERAHGADLYSSEMALTPLGAGRWSADGGKYYIGNANEAAIISTFGKNSETDEYVFFAVDPKHGNYELVKNVVEWQSFVAEFALRGYPITDAQILSTGQQAWDAALNTVNIGKYNLGWASIGICTHAFYEAVSHAAHRNLYGKFVTDFPHIRHLFTDAYARLAAMRLFARRAADYQRAASLRDRRYLLFNPIVKMKVTTQGEEVINLLWDIIAARGFEKDLYFENAAHDIRALPKLEGTVHVNMALIVKFMANYFFNPDTFDPLPRCDKPGHDAFLFNQGPTGGLSQVRFHDYAAVYETFNLPNIEIFKTQIALLRQMLSTAPPDKRQSGDIDFLLCLGELFTLVAYGQLILEMAQLENIDADLIDQIFDVMVRDFARHALALYHHPTAKPQQMELCLRMIKKPEFHARRHERVWECFVRPLADAYSMKP
jgi:acyl-CoA dehydrogenase